MRLLRQKKRHFKMQVSVVSEFLSALPATLSIDLKRDCKEISLFGRNLSSLLVNSKEIFLVLRTKNTIFIWEVHLVLIVF